jgi:hypothetical protein
MSQIGFATSKLSFAKIVKLLDRFGDRQETAIG